MSLGNSSETGQTGLTQSLLAGTASRPPSALTSDGWRVILVGNLGLQVCSSGRARPVY